MTEMATTILAMIDSKTSCNRQSQHDKAVGTNDDPNDSSCRLDFLSKDSGHKTSGARQQPELARENRSIVKPDLFTGGGFELVLSHSVSVYP